MTKQVTLCADDFALSPAIDQAICRLAQAGRLHAISCMTQSPHWPSASRHLLDLPLTVELGLHVNFTEAFPSAQPIWPLTEVIRRAYTHTLDEEAIRISFREQWQAFISAVGRPPAFVDGHQHVHQLPVIRRVILTELKLLNYQGWLRCLADIRSPWRYWLKTFILQTLGGHTLTQHVQQAGFRKNQAFAGVYDFALLDYRQLMQRWLQQVPDGSLIMCHPALQGATDSIAGAREQEYSYLASEQFLADCQAAGVTLTACLGVSRG